MLASKMLIATLKEAPNEAVISSHILLIRAGMIRKLVAGVYNYLPLGLRTLRKIENIIRDEMDQSGSLEILSSAIQPKELWVESGRWQKYGPELIRFNDRHEREFCLGPTHEEIFTDLVRNEIKSRKNLPINIYQIQTKYRDELRPRFGLMRGREFIMKDAYSFDLNLQGLDTSYQQMYQTYQRIFDRLQLKYRIVLADTGAIGGSGSHQFMAISDVGESDIVYCQCGYAADVEKATSKVSQNSEEVAMKEIEKISTPKIKTITELINYLNISPDKIVKTMIYIDSSKDKDQVVLALVRGDRDLNEIKLVNALGIAEHELRLANNNEIVKAGLVEGFAGPVNVNLPIFIDEEVTKMNNFIVGANELDYHLQNVNYNRDFSGTITDLRLVREGDKCPVCGKKVLVERGIEIGQIFKLGTKYSEAMKCCYQNEQGENIPIVMGCYGIGVTRTMSSIIEQHHDEFGIKWPLNVAPYHTVVVPINYQDDIMRKKAEEVYQNLKQKGVEVILDDRDERPGFKFKDWELIGIPYTIIVGRRAQENICEFKERATLEKVEMSFHDASNLIIKAIQKMKV